MKKYHYKQILELVKTINEAQNAKHYGDCQEAALSICDFIDEIEGVGTQTVALFERYCELLFKANSGEIGEKLLRKHMIKIENSVKHELKPKRLEIVFLSYKASMSDSMETIYIAAKNDPDCNALWIPIPYFDRNPDGSFGEMHYEGAECYGAHIEITDWQNYDIAARRPDIIFTFSTYDDANIVTSIHPDFYCSRLRTLTDLLVYVPYFVSPGGVEEHFCTASACVCAHKVIIESEAIRDIYIEHFMNAYGSQLGNPKEKFIALGSSKFDVALNSKRENFNLPENWAQLMSGKKVVLYNTTIDAILKGNEQYLDKLKSVLNCFRERNDIVLWWRPHPLSAATYETMRPLLKDEYKQIVINYKHEGWGIFDDTPNLHRAISMSDAYYGDWSSLVTLYQCLDKPIMIQGFEEMQSDFVMGLLPEHLQFFQLCITNSFFWLTDRNLNALFKMDRETWQLEYVCSFPDEDLFTRLLYRDVLKVGDKLCFSPGSAGNIAFYNLSNASFNIVPIPTPKTHIKFAVEYREAFKFYKIFETNGMLYYIPGTYPGILVYNMSYNKIEVIDDWIEPLNKLIFDGKYGYFGRGITDRQRNCLILPCLGVNAFAELDLSSNKIETGTSTFFRTKN